MNMFWLIAAAMFAIAAGFVVLPLIRSSRPLALWSGFAAAFALPTMAIGWYLIFGAGTDAVTQTDSPHPNANVTQVPQENVGSVASMIGKVIVGARISKSGSATPQPGDLTGSSEIVSVATRDSVRLVIRTKES